MKSSQNETQKQRTATLRTYSTPQLLVYGALKELTATGAGSKVENTGNDLQPGKRP